jgi:type I restriction enzyme, S subunit
LSARAGWTRKALGELMTLNQDPVKVCKTEAYANLGLYSFGRGPFVKPPIDGRRTSASTLYRVRADQFVYSRLFAFEGAFAVVPHAMDGWYVSNEYPTFDVDPKSAVAEFVRLAIARQQVWTELAARTIGMGHRRQRLQPDALLSYEIDVPPVDEQRAIVAAVALADEAVASALGEISATSDLLDALSEKLLAGHDTAFVRDVVVKIEAGRSPKCPNRPMVFGDRGVLRVSAIRPREFRPSEAKPVPAEFAFPDRARVQRGDVLIGRANTRALVGAVCLVDVDTDELYLSDKTLRLVPNRDRVEPEFLVHALRSVGARAHIEGAARGTSDSMKNISHADIFATPIPVPRLLEQRSIAAKLETIRHALRDARASHSALLSVRLGLAEALLSGLAHVDGDPQIASESIGELVAS